MIQSDVIRVLEVDPELGQDLQPAALARNIRLTHVLDAEPDGYFCGAVRGAGPGTRYKFRVGGELYPDPASRYQPDGPHGPVQLPMLRCPLFFR